MIETILLKGIINIIVAFTLAYFLFYRRYKNKTLFAGLMMLNIFVFCIMIVIVDGELAVQAGIGLFAILSILRFRSENFEKMELFYLFGGVAIAAVNGVAIIGISLFVANALILFVTWIVDSDFINPHNETIKIELDYMPSHLFNKKMMKKELEQKLKMKINSYYIKKADYVKEIVQFEIDYVA